ncbi:hypothetical protein V22_34830 [Calycomorphotria hydatis]|uniref:Uncharacterized protein n=1 Tax=Calycomorphotria hydatis TaxID=2528027 RepID=A0A517TCX9_9PLAN|nr:hypothetical protein V22_34830 [Calycomorphotria hydatis]
MLKNNAAWQNLFTLPIILCPRSWVNLLFLNSLENKQTLLYQLFRYP